MTIACRVPILVVAGHGTTGADANMRTLLSFHPEWEVCGEVATGKQAVERIPELKPDVVVFDMSVPGRGGFESIGEIRRVAPNIRLLVVSAC